MWVVPFFVKKPAASALTARSSLKSRLLHGSVKEGRLASFVQVVDHLLETYATEDVILKRSQKLYASSSEQKHVTNTISQCPMDE